MRKGPSSAIQAVSEPLSMLQILSNVGTLRSYQCLTSLTTPNYVFERAPLSTPKHIRTKAHLHVDTKTRSLY